MRRATIDRGERPPNLVLIGPGVAGLIFCRHDPGAHAEFARRLGFHPGVFDADDLVFDLLGVAVALLIHPLIPGIGRQEEPDGQPIG